MAPQAACHPLRCAQSNLVAECKNSRRGYKACCRLAKTGLWKILYYLRRADWQEWAQQVDEVDDDYAARIRHTFTFSAENVPEHLRIPDHHTDGRTPSTQQGVFMRFN